jgi:hypothetical protein
VNIDGDRIIGSIYKEVGVMKVIKKIAEVKKLRLKILFKVRVARIKAKAYKSQIIFNIFLINLLRNLRVSFFSKAIKTLKMPANPC